MEEEKKDKIEKTEELDLNSKIKENIEKKIKSIVEADSIDSNVDYFSKLINIIKNIENIDYWKSKEEENMYREYGEYNDGSYGRRGVPGTGRRSYRDGGSYGRRGVPGTGRGRYRGEEMLDEMAYQYGNYSEGKEMYGADQDTMKSFKYMLKAFKDYYKHLKQEASSQEEVQMLEETAREMMDM